MYTIAVSTHSLFTVSLSLLFPLHLTSLKSVELPSISSGTSCKVQLEWEKCACVFTFELTPRGHLIPIARYPDIK